MGLIENKKIIREYINKIVNTGETKEIEKYISQDYVEIHNNKREKIEIEAVKSRVLGIRKTFPDLKIEIDNQIAEGDIVVTCCTLTGTHLGEWLNMTPTGKKVRYTGVIVDKIKNHKIVEHGGAVNNFDAFLEIGAIKIV